MPLTNAEKQAQFRQRQKEKGRIGVYIYLSKSTKRKLDRMAKRYGSMDAAIETAIKECNKF